MKKLAFIVKPFLNIVAWVLKLSRHNIYYLITGPLKKEIEEESQFAFAHQHIENAIFLANNKKRIIGNCILDVGGGQATTAVKFSTAFPDIKVHVFEPIKSNFEIIETSEHRTKNWVLHNKAVGSIIEKKQINLAQRITASSLLELNNAEIDGIYGKSIEKRGIEEISITTIDAEIDKKMIIEILKIDVQGYELEVLKGATQTLNRIKVIIIEINNHSGFKGAPTYYEIDAFLREHHFELFDILPSSRQNGKLLDWDSIYLNKNMI
jgi:FkbM family methyltransferase